MSRPSAATGGDLVVEVASFSKTFPAQAALVDFDLGLRRGEVHALVGENGSGKSTLIKCMSGYQPPDPGAKLTVDGEAVALPFSAGQAAAHGLVFVHQDLGVVPTLSVMENIALGAGFVVAGGRIRWGRQAQVATSLLERMGRPDIPPDRPAGQLSASSRAIVAIARGLAQAAEGARLLVLDEPTASLPEAEVEVLFAAVRRLADEGLAVLFVSHRLAEVFEISHRVTVLRDGRKVGTFDTPDLDERKLVQLIIGRELSARYPDEVVRPRRELVLEVRGLTGRRVQGVSFAAHSSEIVGIAGLLGSGRSELLRLLYGAQARSAGEVLVDGRVSRPASPREGISDGIALVPEDRLSAGALTHMSVAENMSLPTVTRHWRGGRLRRGEERARIAELMRRFNIQPPDPDWLMGRLSGGNQQKAILAKWIETDPRVLLLDEPVQGVDVGSKGEIYELIERLAEERGMTVLVASSDFDDLQAVCHRVLVLRAGMLVGDLSEADKSVDRMLELAYIEQRAA